MLSPCAYRAALLDLLTSSAAGSQELESERVAMQVKCAHDHPAQARRPYVPSLRLTRRSAPPLADESKRPAVHMTPVTSAAAAAPSSPVAPVNETPSAPSNHCVFENSPLCRGNSQTRVCATSSCGCSGVRQCPIDQPTSGSAAVEEQSPSLILSFIDNCICAGVPESVIAEQVQFMVSSMKESLTLHAALHARQHKDRIREYELNELAAMLERQQLQFAQQQTGPSVLASDPARSSSSQMLAPPPPLRYAPSQWSESDACSSAVRAADAQSFRYTSISQRLSNELWSAPAKKCESLQQRPDNGRPSLSSRRTRSRAAHNLQDGAASSPAVPVFSWRPRVSVHASATGTPTAPAARFMSPDGGVAAVTSSAGRVRNTPCYHRRHHKLCSVCYPDSTSVQSSSPLIAQAAAVTASPADEWPAAQQCSPTGKWRQRWIPSQHYMKPTHTSLARWESKVASVSPLPDTPPGAARSLREGGRVKSATSRRRRGDNSPLSTRRAVSAVAECRATPLKPIVRSTHSSRLRAAVTSRQQAYSSSSTSAASSNDGNGNAHGELAVRGDAALASARKCREGVGCLGELHTPEAQQSVAPSAAAVGGDSPRATLERMPTSVVRIDPCSGTPSPSPSPSDSPSAWNAKAPSQSTQEATEERQLRGHCCQHVQDRRLHPPRLSSRGTGSVSSLPAFAASVVEDDCSDTNLCVTSPALQLFMELSQRKLRETERVLALAPAPSRIASSSCLGQSLSPIPIANASQSRALRDSTAVSSSAPSSSFDAQQTLSIAKGWSDRSLDAVRAQQQQRLAELHQRLSSYGTPSSPTSRKSPRVLAGTAALATRPSAVMDEVPHELQQSTSVIHQPHDAPSVLLEKSPFTQISPTSSDDEHG